MSGIVAPEAEIQRQTQESVKLDADEQALVDAFEGATTGRIVEIVSKAEDSRPPSRVREAYWELVSEGVLVPDAAGGIRVRLAT